MHAPRKRCPACDTPKPRTSYYAHPTNPDGCQRICKQCDNAARSARAAYTPDDEREYKSRRHGKLCPACYDLPHRRARPVCAKCCRPYAADVVHATDPNE